MEYLPKLQKFNLWFPNIFEFKGGIQVYSAFLLEALQSLYPNIDYDVFLKHDKHSLNNLTYLQRTKFHFSGSWPLRLRTLVFSIHLLGYGLWQRPNLIISTHLNFSRAAYWLKRLTGVPYWVVAHGVDAWNINNPDLQKALHFADKILAVSNYTRDRLIKEQDLEPAKVSLLPNTFDASRFQIASKPKYLLDRYQLTKENKIILTVARLDSAERYKGYDCILEALPQIRQTIPEVHYLLVGKGSDLVRIKKLINSLNIEECVTLAGFVPDEELNDYYNLCDVFAMPSKGEGFGIVYLEALACGKPTLGGNKDGAIDALCGGQLGALVDPDNLQEITETIISILQGKYPNTLIYQPEQLRQAVIDIFGFESFKSTLSSQIIEYFNPSNL